MNFGTWSLPIQQTLELQKWHKMAVLQLLEPPKLISHKIWMIEKSRNYHTELQIIYRLPSDQQKVSPSPFCQAFPLEVSCTVPNVGAAGGEQNFNGLCVLSQNIINQKMYLVIWFWMTSLICITPLCMVYRLCTLFFDCFRSGLLMGKCYIKLLW